jgi:hypothetical protein
VNDWLQKNPRILESAILSPKDYSDSDNYCFSFGRIALSRDLRSTHYAAAAAAAAGIQF